jgi:hypothetical protein
METTQVWRYRLLLLLHVKCKRTERYIPKYQQKKNETTSEGFRLGGKGPEQKKTIFIKFTTQFIPQFSKR